MHSKEWQKKLPQYYLNTSKIKHFFSKEETLQNSFLKHIWFSDNFNGNKSQIISFSSLMWVHTNHDEFHIQPAQIMLCKKYYWWMEVPSQFTNVYGEIFHASVKVFVNTPEKIQIQFS